MRHWRLSTLDSASVIKPARSRMGRLGTRLHCSSCYPSGARIDETWRKDKRLLGAVDHFIECSGGEIADRVRKVTTA